MPDALHGMESASRFMTETACASVRSVTQTVVWFYLSLGMSGGS